MTNRLDAADRFLDAREGRRLARDDRFLSRLERRENEAERLVGELCREGRTVYYINVLSMDGRMTGKTREFDRHYAAITFLLRNNYV